MDRLAKQPGPESARAEAGLSRSRFCCCLDQQPDHLVPRHFLQNQAGADAVDRPLFVNPNCCFTKNDEMPVGVGGTGELFPSLMTEKKYTAWVKDPCGGMTLPFQLKFESGELLSGLAMTDSVPVRFTHETRHALQMAGILVPEDWGETRTRQWNAAVSRGSEEFLRRGFVPVRRLIHPFHISALRRYYRSLIRRGQMRLGDSQCSQRYAAYNEPVARFFHCQLAPAVSALVGEPVQPSYVYVGSYQQGAELERHKDREQCEFSISICIDYAPEPRFATPWPIQLHTGSGTTSVFQAIGDGLLYRGREIPHSRAVLSRGHASTSIFFHYVGESFTGSLC